MSPLAQTVNGPYKTELIKPRKPSRTAEQVELATAEGVDLVATTIASTTTAVTSQPISQRYAADSRSSNRSGESAQGGEERVAGSVIDAGPLRMFASNREIHDHRQRCGPT
jgi:hypothetical protein